MCETYDDRYNKSSSTRQLKQSTSQDSSILGNYRENENAEKVIKVKPAFWTSILAGGTAGIVVDFALYPLDTIKTRLQSEVGFKASGGFSKLYRGIVPVILSSAPVSALFFSVYNTLINTFRTEKGSLNALVYIVSASVAELVCASVRVPLEVLKQRKQTSSEKSFNIIKKAVNKEGFLGMYRGFSGTMVREIPFACIQYPLWEYMLSELTIYQNGKPLSAVQTALCGALAGGVAGTLTTPVDVIRTRIILAEKEKIELYKPRVYQNFVLEVYSELGISGFFSGVVPRALWIMFGGFIYFGAYDAAKKMAETKSSFFKSSGQKVQD